jgi:peptidoglycan/xylan/chitin deacetylase (PgdA/CDA1 family)
MRRAIRFLRRCISHQSSPVILMYHRVAEPLCDPWGLAVSPIHFEQQMRVLRAHRTPLPMSEFVQRLCLGTLPDRAVGITFDDGYIDNLLNAKSILRRYEIPATFFLVT